MPQLTLFSFRSLQASWPPEDAVFPSSGSSPVLSVGCGFSVAGRRGAAAADQGQRRQRVRGRVLVAAAPSAAADLKLLERHPSVHYCQLVNKGSHDELLR